MIEQKWPTVPPRLLTEDGTNQGLITTTSTAGVKVKQIIILQAPSLAQSQFQVKRVISNTQFVVGPIPGSSQLQGKAGLKVNSDVSIYTVALGSFFFAAEQDKAKLKPDDILQAIYDQEPTVGLRAVLIDQFGEYFESVTGNDGVKRLAVDAEVNVSSVQLFTKPFDTITAEYPSSTQEIYKSRIGGINGAVQETVTVNYTDASKNLLLNVSRT